MVEYLVAACVVLGSFLQLVAALGLVILPRFLLRLHASSKASTLGAGFILLGIGLHYADLLVSFKVFVTMFFIFICSPTVAHLFAKSYLRPGSVPGRNHPTSK